MKTVDIESAAQWLAGQENPPRPIVPNLRFIFKLTAIQAVEAIRRANDLRREAGKPVPRFRPNRRRGRRKPKHLAGAQG